MLILNIDAQCGHPQLSTNYHALARMISEGGTEKT